MLCPYCLMAFMAERVETVCPNCARWIRGDTVVHRNKARRKRQLMRLIEKQGSVAEPTLYNRARREGLRMGRKTLTRYLEEMHRAGLCQLSEQDGKLHIAPNIHQGCIP